MIIERNEFRLKFGKAKDAIAIWKELLEEAKKSKDHPEMRMMTDISGPAYTLILEMHLKSMNDINNKNYTWVTTERFQELYQRFIPLCESANREYYKIEVQI